MMLIVLLLVIALLAFMLVRRSQRKRNPEAFAARAAARDARATARKKPESRILLSYSGGHPDLKRSGSCWVTRSEDGQNVELRIGKESVSIPTQSIAKVELVPRSELKTTQKSGIGGAILGEMVAGPAGAIVGGLATRKTKSKTLHKDLVVVTVKNGASELQLLFQWIGNKAPNKWYPRAAAILSPPMEA